MSDRHLIGDVALAAIIASAAVLPVSQAPRSSDSRIAAQGSQIVLADAGIDRLTAEPRLQGRS